MGKIMFLTSLRKTAKNNGGNITHISCNSSGQIILRAEFAGGKIIKVEDGKIPGTFLISIMREDVDWKYYVTKDEIKTITKFGKLCKS